MVGTAAGLDRYEKFVDARDVSSNNGEYTEEEYLKMLEDREIKVWKRVNLYSRLTAVQKPE
nr:hypothetical protein [Robinsoniella sp. KNHs210]